MEKVVKFAKSVFYTVIGRPFRNYNVEERAFKAISATKKSPAPKHLTTQQKILKYIEEHPELKEIVVEKPKTLLEWLKQIRVVSQDVPDTELSKPDKKKLPVKKETYELPRMFGELEPKVIPKGKISLQRTSNLVIEYASMKVKPSAREVAEKYNLEEQDAANLVRHFKAFELYKPAKQTGDYEGLPPWSKSLQSNTFFGAVFGNPINLEEPAKPEKLIEDKTGKEPEKKQIKAE